MLVQKNILITGVSKGLGLEIAKILLEKGAVVFGVSRTKTKILSDLIELYPQHFCLVLFDLNNTEQINEKLFKEFVTNKVPLHGFINNAALAYDDLISNLNSDKLQNMYNVNVFSPMVISKYVVRNMLLHQTKGSIVHISSVSAHTGYKGLSMYASSKGAIEAFSKNLAREWGSLGIRSNCVVAGFMETEMNESLTADQRVRIYQRTALKSPTSLQSVAETVAFLLSDGAHSITGQNVFVDSGTI